MNASLQTDLHNRYRSADVSIVNCANCGAPLRVESDRDIATCDFCRSTFGPKANRDGVRLLGVASQRHCPVCDVPLAQASLARHSLEYCEGCGGMLIPVSVFTAIVEALRWAGERSAPPPNPIAAGTLERALRCPACRRPMHTHPYAGPGNVVIDNCPRCELNWLDARELDRIVSAPDALCNPDAWVAP